MAALLGWIGSFVVLGAYALSIYRGKSLILHWGNAIGSIGLGIAALSTQSWPNFFLTVCFGLFGVVGIVQYHRHRGMIGEQAEIAKIIQDRFHPVSDG